MLRSSRKASVVLALALVSLTAGAAAAYPARATSKLNMRNGPGLQFEIITVIPNGDAVEVERCSEGWCSVSYSTFTGWVSNEFLSNAGPNVPQGRDGADGQSVLGRGGEGGQGGVGRGGGGGGAGGVGAFGGQGGRGGRGGASD